MTNAAPPPAVNGRPWTSILASGAVKEFGALLLFGAAVGLGGWAVYLTIHLLLTQQAAERKQHAEQMDRLVAVLIKEMVSEQKRQVTVTEQVAKTVTHMAQQQDAMAQDVQVSRRRLTQVVERQRGFVLPLERLLKAAGVRQPKLSETDPHKGVGQSQSFPGGSR